MNGRKAKAMRKAAKAAVLRYANENVGDGQLCGAGFDAWPAANGCKLTMVKAPFRKRRRRLVAVFKVEKV